MSIRPYQQALVAEVISAFNGGTRTAVLLFSREIALDDGTPFGDDAYATTGGGE